MDVRALALILTALNLQSSGAATRIKPYSLADALNHVHVTVKYTLGTIPPAMRNITEAAAILGGKALTSEAQAFGAADGSMHDVFRLKDDVDPSNFVLHLSQRPEIASVTLDDRPKAFAASNDPIWQLVPAIPAENTPNWDPSSMQYELNYSLELVGAPTVWQRIASLPRRIINVCVIDTGLDYTHPDLAPNMWVNELENPANGGIPGVDDDGNGYIDDIHGWDAVGEVGDPMDVGRHGTHVSGIVAAAGVRVFGAAGPGSKVKLIGCNAFTQFEDGLGALTHDVSECVSYCIAAGAHITTNSYGGVAMTQTVLRSVKRAEEAGLPFFAAAGNDALETDRFPHYPSNYEFNMTMSIAATNMEDEPANFTNFGYDTVHVGAPGRYIISPVPGGLYANFSGTSMATPLVAGIGAVLMSVNPSLTGYDVKHIIWRTTDFLEDLEVNSAGRVNFVKALDVALGEREPGLGHFPFQKFRWNKHIKQRFDLNRYMITYKYDGWRGYTYCRELIGRRYPAETGVEKVKLGRDESKKVAFRNGFAFPYIGKLHDDMYISSNGYITFEQPDDSSSAGFKKFGFNRLKIAGFQGKLDPSLGGDIYINFIGNEMTVVTFDNVSRFNKPQQRVSYQMLLHADGTIQVHYSRIRFTGKFFIGLFPGEEPRHYNEADFSYAAKCAEGCYTFGCYYFGDGA